MSSKRRNNLMPRHVEIAGQKRHLHGWIPGRPDPRDRVFKASAVGSLFLPGKIDLSPLWVRIENQGEIGSCTANSATSCLEYLFKKSGKPVPELSRLFVYWMTRVRVEHVPGTEDAGAVIRDVMKSLAKYGACLEKSWPYDESKFSIEPTKAAQDEGLKYQLLASGAGDYKPGYYLLPTLYAMKKCLAEGYPFVGGFSVPESMMSEETAKTGIVKLPAKGEEIVGGHAIAFVGYDNSTKLLKFCNSWGSGWGKGGFGFLPYDYFAKGLLSDCWVMRHVEDGR
jgi:C1A family cysteine protease